METILAAELPDLEQRAKNIVAAWRWSSVADGGDFDAFARRLIAEQMPALVKEAIDYHLRRFLQATVDQEALKRLARGMLDEWLSSGEAIVPPPSKPTRDAIEKAMRNLANRPRVFVNEMEQKAVMALALTDANVRRKNIAQQLSVSLAQVDELIKRAREGLNELRQMALIYGYELRPIPDNGAAEEP
jgi:hypothetical protein